MENISFAIGQKNKYIGINLTKKQKTSVIKTLRD